MNEEVKVKGFGFSGFRSIGEKPALLYPLSKVNLFIGSNNAGKSNILRYMYRRFSNSRPAKVYVSDNDYPKYKRVEKDTALFPFVASKTIEKLPLNDLFDFHKEAEEFANVLKTASFNYDSKNDLVWYGDGKDLEDIWNSCSNKFDSRKLGELALSFTGSASRDVSNFGNVVRKLFSENLQMLDAGFKTIYIKAERDLFDHSKNSFIEGKKIIDRLNEIVNHQSSDTIAEKTKRSIESFISSLVGRNVSIKVPHTLNSIILVDEKDSANQYELDQLGSGIHEIIYFAIALTLCQNSLVFIDEPEIHMHPRLQRQFLDFIINNTDNQYFIATHSSSLIDLLNEDVSVFGVSMDSDDCTDCFYVADSKELSTIVDSLGCKASDILQSNCVIWVEGPSDRIYMNYWIHGADETLLEGLDYSIMFYGGRLLSHLTGDPSSICSFVNLLKLNRNSFIVADSDKREESDSINDTKQRIKSEFKDRCWITEGREIENYLNDDEYEKVARRFDEKFTLKNDKYANRLARKANGSLNKVDFAQLIVSTFSIPNLDKYDLKDRIGELVDFIKDSNH